MDTDSLYTGILTAAFHLVRKKRFCNGKEPLVRSKHIAGSDILLQFLTQKIRNRNFPLAFSCLWSGNDILSVKTLIGFIDINLFCDKVNISGSQCQKRKSPIRLGKDLVAKPKLRYVSRKYIIAKAFGCCNQKISEAYEPWKPERRQYGTW